MDNFQQVIYSLVKNGINVEFHDFGGDSESNKRLVTAEISFGDRFFTGSAEAPQDAVMFALAYAIEQLSR